MQLSEPIKETEYFISNLNEITYIKKKKAGEDELLLTGWLFYREHPDQYEIRCSDDQVSMEFIKTERPDVNAAFPDHGVQGSVGFIVRAARGADACGKGISFYACRLDGSEREELVSIAGEELVNYQKPAEIHHTIDRMICRNGQVELNGWAYAEDPEDGFLQVQVSLTDDADKEYEHHFAVLGRPDVTRLLMKDEESDDNWGFHIDWAYENENQIFKVQFVNGETREELVIDIAEKLRTERERKRRYADAKTMRKARDKQTKADDRFYKEHLSEEEYQQIMNRRLDNRNVDYDVWREANLPTEKDLKRQRKAKFAYEPKISIIVPAYRTPEKFLREMIDSVRNQTYGNWELCIADGSLNDSIKGILEEYHTKDPRVCYTILSENYGISGNTNGALTIATGDYISLLDHDDVITVDALYEMVKAINETGADVLYSDEDKVTADLVDYFEPHFKPDFNPDLLHSTNYICHYFMVRKDVLAKAGNFGTQYDGSQDFDFILRCTAIAEKITHVPKILYHWRTHSQSTATNPGQKMYCYDAGRHAVIDALARAGEQVDIVSTSHYGYYRLTYPVQGAPKVTILTIGANREFLEKQVNDKTNKDITIEILYKEQGTSYAELAAKAVGEYLLLLDAQVDDVTAENWISVMLGNCQRNEVGAAGGQIYGNDRKIISSGVVTQRDGSLRDLFAGLDRDDPSYTARGIIQQDVTAVTKNCLMVSREDFLANWIPETGSQEMMQDIRMCDKLLKSGKTIVYLPQIQLHSPVAGEKRDYESITLESKGCGYSPVFDPEGAAFTLAL